MRQLIIILLAVMLLAPCAAFSAAPQGDKTGETAIQSGQTDEAAEKKTQENKDAGIAPVNDTWNNLWSGQREMIQEIRDTALKLSNNFAKQSVDLSHKLQPFEEEGRKFLVFANTFKGRPQPMEAIMWRISATIADINETLEPVHRARGEAQHLLETVNHMADSIPDDSDRSKFSPEMQEYIDSILRARLRLAAVLTQYDTLLPALNLARRLEEAQKTINDDLPELWKNYYLQKPVAWLHPGTWEHLADNFNYSWQIMLMRMPVEIPTTPNLWSAAVLRFFIGLIFASAIALIIRRRWFKTHYPDAAKHIFDGAIPWLVLGFALISAAFSANGDFFRLILSIGSCVIIFGEILLAWDLRLLQYLEEPASSSPFLHLLPLACLAYVLLYLPLPAPPLIILWSAILLCAMFVQKRGKKFYSKKMQFETGIMECYPFILWPCLFLSLSGLQIYSMGVYLIFVALAIALELSLAGMSNISHLNEHLPQEGASAVIARLAVALAAPCVLVLAVIGLCLWCVILPGGTYLLGQYALKGVSFGATQLNIIQLLLIISAFYLTRTIVSMGTRFLAKLPSQGGQFGATMVTPMQTALTYITWAIFGLFALHSLGMSLSNLAMVAGGLSVGIGFGMQTIVNNFLSGLILIFGRTLQVGDVVDVGGTTGRVRKISVRATMVETYDNAVIYVPNSEFMSNRLTNWTSFSRSVRKEIQVGVAYGSDTELVVKLLLDIAKKHKNVLKAPAPSVNFADFAASSLDFRLRFWVRDYELGASTASDLRMTINKVFNEQNIEIAFPQLDIHIKDIPGKTGSFPIDMPKSKSDKDASAES